MSEHAPTPYRTNASRSLSGGYEIISEDNLIVAHCPAYGDAEFLVRAVNNIESLVEVCKAALGVLEAYKIEELPAGKMLRAEIAKATGDLQDARPS